MSEGCVFEKETVPDENLQRDLRVDPPLFGLLQRHLYAVFVAGSGSTSNSNIEVKT